MKNINAAYVDGISLSHGYPRKHIWTFMASLRKNVFATHGQGDCPCGPNSPVTSPLFVGNDYISVSQAVFIIFSFVLGGILKAGKLIDLNIQTI